MYLFYLTIVSTTCIRVHTSHLYIGLGSIIEPSTIIYSIDSSSVDYAAKHLEEILPSEMQDEDLVQRCIKQRVLRMNIFNDSVRLTVGISQKRRFIYANMWFRCSRLALCLMSRIPRIRIGDML